MRRPAAPAPWRDLRPVLFVAAAFVTLQLASVNRYGIFRDELYYIACGEHLAWGYVDHPPFVAFVAWLSRSLFGDSLLAIRFLSVAAGGATLLLAGRLSLAFGGDRWAAALAAVSVAIAPALLFVFHILSMNAWDVLWWTATAWVLARIVIEGRPQGWLSAGALVGIGLETKISMAFLVAGLATAIVLTRERRWLRDPYFWSGCGIAAALAAPHLAWQAVHGWPTLEFIRNADALKNAPLGPLQFAGSQLLELHPLNGALLLLGLWFFFTAQDGRFRVFGWVYVTVFLIVFLQGGKTYYLAPTYPFMLAGGSVAASAALAGRASVLRPAALAAVLVAGAVVAPMALPILPLDRYIAYTGKLGLRPPDAERHASGALPQFFADMFGWDAIVRTVGEVYQRLSPEDRVKAAIVAPNYGVAGAIDFLGPRHGLPAKAISPHNSYYLWGTGGATGEILIVIGGTAEEHRAYYDSVEQVATIECGYCMPYENGRAVYILRSPKRSLEEIWRRSKMFI